MTPEALAKLRQDIHEQVELGATTFGLIGSDPSGIELIEMFRRQLPGLRVTWFGRSAVALSVGNDVPLDQLEGERPEVVVVAEDAEKEAVLLKAEPYMAYVPTVLVAGYEHYQFRSPEVDQMLADLLVPSIANGYPDTLVHLYQCLVNAARLGLQGSVVEFGVFKGGTTMFLTRVVRRLERDWPVIGFDTFGGFPARRSPFDMYSHPGATFHDFEAVSRYLEPEGVRLVRGDIVETAQELGNTPVVVAFVDTDNYSSARAAVTALKENVVVGGAIVFDHLAGVARFRYTLGERMAAKELLDNDDRYFNLHGTGVFLRLK